MTKSKIQNSKRPIESYEHRDKQGVTNPPVGLVNPCITSVGPHLAESPATFYYVAGFWTKW